MAPFIVERAERLARLYPHPGIDRPLLKAYPIDIDVIKVVAERVLATSFGLDNITPNGAVMERPENEKYLKLFRQAVLNEIDVHGLSDIAPPVLRAQSESHKDRPYSTEKMHSDVWRGDPRYTLVVILPIWGCEYSKVVFREPIADDFRPLENYDQGKTEGVDYDVPFHAGFVYYCDAFCLHQTVHTQQGQRVSADLRGLYSERLPNEESPWTPVSIFLPNQ